MHNGKIKMCNFFVAHNASPPVLGMQDIDKLGLLSINHNSKYKEMVEEGNKTIARVQGKWNVTTMSSLKARSRKQ